MNSNTRLKKKKVKKIVTLYITSLQGKNIRFDPWKPQSDLSKDHWTLYVVSMVSARYREYPAVPNHASRGWYWWWFGRRGYATRGQRFGGWKTWPANGGGKKFNNIRTISGQTATSFYIRTTTASERCWRASRLGGFLRNAFLDTKRCQDKCIGKEVTPHFFLQFYQFFVLMASPYLLDVAPFPFQQDFSMLLIIANIELLNF